MLHLLCVSSKFVFLITLNYLIIFLLIFNSFIIFSWKIWCRYIKIKNLWVWLFIKFKSWHRSLLKGSLLFWTRVLDMHPMAHSLYWTCKDGKMKLGFGPFILVVLKWTRRPSLFHGHSLVFRNSTITAILWCHIVTLFISFPNRA